MRHQLAEEVQPLMWANALRQAFKQMGPGFMPTTDLLESRIANFNASRAAAGQRDITLGRERSEAIIALTLHVPAAAFDQLFHMYLDFTWPYCWVNARMCGHPALIPGKWDKQAKGPWVAVYTNDEASVKMLVDSESLLWRERFPLASLSETTLASVRDARPTYEALTVRNLRYLWWTHWAFDKVKAEITLGGADASGAASQLKQVTSMFVKGFFDDDVDDMVTARTQPSAHAIMTLASCPSLARAVNGQAARLSDSEVARQNATGTETKFNALLKAIGQDQRSFETSVKDENDKAAVEVRADPSHNQPWGV